MVDTYNADLRDAEGAARVCAFDLWRHADDQTSRDKAIAKLAEMLRERRKGEPRASPVCRIGCPGLIRDDGSIDRGGQNLPGNWEAKTFNLPDRIRELIPSIGGHETAAGVHNDPSFQG